MTLASSTGDNIAIGRFSDQNDQQGQAVAIGDLAGQTGQGTCAVAVGSNAGNDTQNSYAVAIGLNAGQNGQQESAVAIGRNAASDGQQVNAIAIGNSSAGLNQGSYAVAIGASAGYDTQANGAVSIGQSAGQTSQALDAVAIGSFAGQTDQSAYSVAIGFQAGKESQYASSVAIGNGAGASYQRSNAVAIGTFAGANNQKSNAVAIGAFAGRPTSNANTIILNATGENLPSQRGDAFYVAPIRTLTSPLHEFARPLAYTANCEIVSSNYINVGTAWTIGPINSDLNIFSGAGSGNVITNGHLVSTAPSFTQPCANVSANVSIVSCTGTDMCGQIVFTVSQQTSEILLRVSFHTSYSALPIPPIVTLTKASANAISPYVTSTSTYFDVGATALGAGTYTLNYMVIGL
jgi:hypothetical protein